ncbi:BRE1-domain-containing protein [Wolfiporia cocos MD-104 SS10]|uniref:E3 ubiquitin protein ligase n=1 Tax=Wolfiporia cocos (strain MD-104) TaxID=742152 RepID=A0A2H3JNY1_WOLCO|nr:BRE1-domain-containing protein [Wolfiporia cocos MD-104 SS10]
MSETRKRPHAEDAEQSRSKKRAMTEEHATTSNQANGVGSHPDEPRDGDNLEMFRKDAIYRRMKHYSREYERSEARVAELERRRNTCEAGLAALEACWTQIIETIRILVKPEELPPAGIKPDDIYDLTSHVSADRDTEYLDALRDKMHATSELVGAFARIGGQGKSSIAKDEMYRHCQRAQTECSSLRSELSLARSRLRDVEQERDQYREELVSAEKRLDRLQSKVVGTGRNKVESPEETVKADSPLEAPDSPAVSGSSPQATNGTANEDSIQWRVKAQVQEKHAIMVARENAALREEISRLTAELKAPSMETITDSHYYKALLEKASRLQHEVAESRNDANRVREELSQLEATRVDFEKSAAATAEQTVQELRVLVTKRDNENMRLREQRDQQLSELNERKQREHVKLNSLAELKTLAESRSGRIKVLESEVARLKTRLAANAHDEDLMAFFFKDSAEDPNAYISDLRSRLSSAETRLNALEATMAQLQQEQPGSAKHIEAEAELRGQLAALHKRLDEYQSIYGDSLSTTPEVQALSQQLKAKEDEIQRLRLQEQQFLQADKLLQTELDTLTAAWETLETQVKKKVFDLTSVEERLTKSQLDKAKSDNKYFAAMRDKEASETERKNVARNLEKQAKVVEKLHEAEDSLRAQIGVLEKELSARRKFAEIQLQRIRELETEHAGCKTQAEGDKKRVDEMRASITEQIKNLHRERTQLRKMDEEAARAKAEAERQTTKMKSLSQNMSASSSTREAQLQSESILKCSTCRQNMRNTVITKCMHSFCKSCVEARIATRQRKCPACNLPFSQGEVQQLFFQ